MKHVTVKIPGKVMLAGEYAVLDGGSALATTVDRYMTVDVYKTPAVRGITLRSELWEEDKSLPANPDKEYEEPLMHAAAFAMNRYDISGLELEVTSDLDINYGIGSSSALRLGVLTGISAIKDPAGVYSWNKAEDAFTVQRTLQSRCSGYDIATQLCGGIVSFKTESTTLDTATDALTDLIDSDLSGLVQVLVGGKGAPTKTVMMDTLAWLKEGELHSELHSLSQDLVDSFVGALTDDDTESRNKLISSVASHRRFFESSPHFPKDLLGELQGLEGFDQSFSFKTTGAGGEDAILIIGSPEDRSEATTKLKTLGWEPLEADFSSGGMEICWHGEEVQ